MKDIFEKLKQAANGKLKAYNEPISADQMAFAGDLLCSYVVEDGLVRQAVLTVSHKNKGFFDAPDGFDVDVRAVFGSTKMIMGRTYPSRGFCRQYVFPVGE